MSVEAVNGYTLLAEPADWSQQPQWTLKWDTEIAPALRGNEGRGALREAPRPVLAYQARPLRIETQARLMLALTTALASGQACAPTWGRASWLAAATAAGAGALTIEPSAWEWRVGGWLLIYADDGSHATGQVTAINAAGTGLTVPGGLGSACSAGAAVYPLFFGRPSVDDIEQTNGGISAASITLTGDEFFISGNIPPVCVVAAPVQPVDFAVARFTYGYSSGEDLNPRFEIASPVIAGAASLTFSADGSNTSNTLPGGHSPSSEFSGVFIAVPGGYHDSAADPATAETVRVVLVNLSQLAAANAAAASIAIRLRGCWNADVGDGTVQLRVDSFSGGAMQLADGTDGVDGVDFRNIGGAARPTITAALHVSVKNDHGFSSGPFSECGTLVYTPAAGTLVYNPPPSA